MKKASFHILRIGLAVTFLWIGVLIFKQPEACGGYLQPWAAKLLPIPIAQAMVATAILDIGIGVLLLVNRLVWMAALAGAIHLIIVLATSGVTDITVRDVGLLAAALALAVNFLPKSFYDKIMLRARDSRSDSQK